MKIGGVSWNTSQKHKSGVQSKHSCNLCNRQYKMEWAKVNHEKKCKEYHKREEKLGENKK